MQCLMRRLIRCNAPTASLLPLSPFVSGSMVLLGILGALFDPSRIRQPCTTSTSDDFSATRPLQRPRLRHCFLGSFRLSHPDPARQAGTYIALKKTPASMPHDATNDWPAVSTPAIGFSIPPSFPQAVLLRILRALFGLLRIRLPQLTKRIHRPMQIQ